MQKSRSTAALVAALAFGFSGALVAGETPEAPATADAQEAAVPQELESLQTIVSVAGVQVAIDPETGRLVPPTPQQAKKLAAQMQRMFKSVGPGKKDTTPVFRADGTISAVVPLEHLNSTIATLDQNGEIVTECLSTEEDIADFLAGTSDRDSGEDS